MNPWQDIAEPRGMGTYPPPAAPAALPWMNILAPRPPLDLTRPGAQPAPMELPPDEWNAGLALQSGTQLSPESAMQRMSSPGESYTKSPADWAEPGAFTRQPESSMVPGGDTYAKTIAQWSEPGAFSATGAAPASPAGVGAASAPIKGFGVKQTKSGSVQSSGSIPKGAFDGILADLDAREVAALEAQGISIKELKGKLGELEGKELPKDLTPWASLIDSWTGSNFAASYKPPETGRERQSAKEKMQAAILQAEQGLSENEISRMRSKLNNQFQMENLLEGKAQHKESNAIAREQMASAERIAAQRVAEAGKAAGFKPSQWTAATYGHRMNDSNKTMSALYQNPDTLELATSMQGTIDRMLPGGIKDPNVQMLDQAERNFVNAILRRESGSAINKSEFKSAELQYFPRQGDSPELVAQKNQGRDRVIEGLRLESEGAWNHYKPFAAPTGGPDAGAASAKVSTRAEREAELARLEAKGGK